MTSKLLTMIMILLNGYVSVREKLRSGYDTHTCIISDLHVCYTLF